MSKSFYLAKAGDEFFAGYGRYRAGRRLLGAKPLMRAGPALKAGILHQDIAAGLQERQHALSIAFPPPSFADKLLRPSSALRHLQRVDSQTWLPDNLLVKLDRCLMRYGVEGRTPFIDKVMSPYGYHLRASAKDTWAAGQISAQAVARNTTARSRTISAQTWL